MPTELGDGVERDAETTANRWLLRGARHHQRDGVFVEWGRNRAGHDRFTAVPDWRADRNALRAGLVLHEHFELAAGEHVALWAPLSKELAWIERGAWGLGAVTVPVGAGWSPSAAAAMVRAFRPKVIVAPSPDQVRALRAVGVPLPRATVVLQGAGEEPAGVVALEEVMHRGGILDTPERAVMWRNSARAVPPEAPCTVELAQEGGAPAIRGMVSQGALAAAIRSIQDRFPPRAGRVQVLERERLDGRTRAFLYAGWADGRTRTLLGVDESLGRRLAELRPEIFVACLPARLAFARSGHPLIDWIRPRRREPGPWVVLDEVDSGPSDEDWRVVALSSIPLPLSPVPGARSRDSLLAP